LEEHGYKRFQETQAMGQISKKEIVNVAHGS
jgi:hypothetical protein